MFSGWSSGVDTVDMESTEKILILNGATSSGKTSLSKELQDTLDEPYIHLEEDRFVYGTYHGRYLQTGMVEEIFRKTMLGYYRSIAAFAGAGHNVIADTGFYTRELAEVCVAELAGLGVWLIGVHCSVEELDRRERARGDREVGEARKQAATIHEHVVYDVEVDTSTQSLRKCAEAIREVVTSGRRPLGSDATRRRLAAR